MPQIRNKYSQDFTPLNLDDLHFAGGERMNFPPDTRPKPSTLFFTHAPL